MTHKQVASPALIILHTLGIVAFLWKLHGGFGLSVDNIIPLYRIDIAEHFA